MARAARRPGRVPLRAGARGDDAAQRAGRHRPGRVPPRRRGPRTGPDGPSGQDRLDSSVHARPVRRVHGRAAPPRGRSLAGRIPTPSAPKRVSPDERVRAGRRRPRRRRLGRRRRRRRDDAGVGRPGPTATTAAVGGPHDGERRRSAAAAAGRQIGSDRPRRRSSSSACSSCSSTLLDLWTDALWFHSVGFDACSGPASAPRPACSSAALVVCLVVLLGNLWLAGRLAPPAEPGRRRPSGRSVRSAERGRRGGRAAGAPAATRPVAAARTSPGPSPSSRTHPRPRRPLATAAVLAVVGVFIAARDRRRRRRRPGRRSCSGSTACRSRPTRRPPSTDPIFGRTSASSCSSCRSCASSRRCSTAWSSRPCSLTLGRYLVGGVARRPRLRDAGPGPPRGPRRRCSCCRSRSATSSTSSSSSYSTRGRRRPASATPTTTPSSSPSTLLTVMSGLAAAFLVGGGLHPDAVAARADHRRLAPGLARHRPALPGGRPALQRRAEPVRPGGARTSPTTSR